MRIRTALSAALVSLAAVIALFVAGPGAEVNDAAADPLVLIAVEPEVAAPASATDRFALHARVTPWDCPLGQASTGDQ
ncbi:hypothetical protein DMB66_48235 [Actinoplanes sp. ATCC 53533]|uniref:hypothetical protein n=1 Tax=Actinoplanes sp. ATCC 53533 TaxID=1288362 RepID=UPI000F77B9CC|nr:hypothetical protein [Actinoplanes sp. ATCC 53533]RSM47537.1 hypothetical protein DMB66_48235 [Actinoplanes sp. ATCC 53533]